MRAELAVPGLQLVDEQAYNGLFTIHGTAMMLLFATPMVAAFANYLIPLQVGAADMVFPRLNALSFWLFLFGGLVVMSVPGRGRPGGHRLDRLPPNSTLPYSTTTGTDLWIVGLILTGASSILGAVNFVATIFTRRAPGMGMFRGAGVHLEHAGDVDPAILYAFPAITAALAMLLLERGSGRVADPSVGGDPILWQHLFWFFGHPEVYIIALPFFGVIGETIPVFSRKPLFGYRAFVLATVFIGAYSMTVGPTTCSRPARSTCRSSPRRRSSSPSPPGSSSSTGSSR